MSMEVFPSLSRSDENSSASSNIYTVGLLFRWLVISSTASSLRFYTDSQPLQFQEFFSFTVNIGFIIYKPLITQILFLVSSYLD